MEIKVCRHSGVNLSGCWMVHLVLVPHVTVSMLNDVGEGWITNDAANVCVQR